MGFMYFYLVIALKHEHDLAKLLVDTNHDVGYQDN